MKRFPLILAVLCVVGLSACSSPGKLEQRDLSSHFAGFTGTFKLHDLSTDKYIVYGSEAGARRTAPASTFKVLHSLIALQTGVVANETSVMKWDGTIYPTPEWNRDQTLKSAVRDSVVWYFQAVARQVGRDREQEYLSKVGYGNHQIGDALDAFWLDGTLAISVDEQLDFMTRLYKEDLPFNRQVIRTVKDLIVVRQDQEVILAGKTGSAVRTTPNVGWYVGYVVVHDKPYTFATRIEGNGAASGARAKQITEQILTEIGLLFP